MRDFSRRAALAVSALAVFTACAGTPTSGMSPAAAGSSRGSVDPTLPHNEIERGARPSAEGDAPSAGPASSSAVVSILINGQSWDWTSPWTKQRPWTRRVNGVVIEGKRILVTGEQLGDHTLIEVQKLGQPQRYAAKAKLIDYDIPLALLEVNDPDFWQGTSPLPIAPDLPREGQVSVCRWLGSGQFEEAVANVRQIRIGDHWPGRTQVLTLDMSSPIEEAGWSEVVVWRGQVLGLTTSKSGNQLAAIAAPVLRTFIESAAMNPYPGVARHGFGWQTLTNPALRGSLGLTPDEGGILVLEVLTYGSAGGVLEPKDVVLEIAGRKIDRVGKYDDPRYGKLFFGGLFTNGTRPGDTIEMKILRNGQRMTVKAKLDRMLPEEDRVPAYAYDKKPEWFTIGGLVFQHLTRSYLQTWRDWWKRAPLRLLIAYDEHGAQPTPEQPRFVVLTKVLPDPVNIGYQDLGPMLVTKVNGQPVGSIPDLERAFKKPVDGFHVIELLPGQSTQRIVLDASEMDAAAPRIAEQYGLRASE